MGNSLVTICITTYNRKNILPLTLKSVLRQTYSNIEIIIVDDYSNDGTEELVKNNLLKLDSKIRYIRHEKNKGLATGRNTAINNAEGKYFTFCDDDDEWENNFIEEFVKIAENYDETWFFYCGGQYKNYLGTKVNVVSNYEGTIKQHIKEGYTPPVASQFYNSKSLKKVKGYNINIQSGVDHDLWIRLSKVDMNIKAIPKALSMPNLNASDERMTTNYEKRITGIKNSLLVWRNDLEMMFGNNFYNKFCNTYLERERLKFFDSYLREYSFKKAWIIRGNISIAGFLKMSSLTCIKMIFGYIIPKVFISKEKTKFINPILKITQ